MTCTRARALQLIVMAAITALVFATGARAQELEPGGTFIDDNGNPHEGAIEAIFAEGITDGCDESGTRYCPNDVVTRAQMASFLASALDLPAATDDYFGDDDGSPHEDSINRIAEAEITLGVQSGVFDPNGIVPRDQMASFLARAIPDLVPATEDHFDDDEGNVHEDNIDIVATNGITLGCGEERLYCPDDTVSRDQMASFLARALGLEEIIPPPLELPHTGAITEDEARALFAIYFPPEDVEDALVIAKCESNLIVDIVNPAGPYVGLFQHVLSAWDSRAAAVGFAGESYANPYANTAAAAWLKGDGPWSQHWPGCSTLLN